MIAPKTLAPFIALAALTACNDSNFASGGDEKPAVQTENAEPVEKTINLTCDEDEGSAHLVTDLSTPGKAVVKIEGEFCGLKDVKQEGSLTVLFLVDISGSMLDNDPLTAGSCGRLKAAEAIVDKLEASIAEGVELQLAAINFADTNLPAAGPFPVSTFRSQLTPENLCLDNGGGTNYEAGFAGARTLLAPMEGTKVIYFISDGLPTRGGAGPEPGSTGIGGLGDELDGVYEAGRLSAARLRTEVRDVTLNAIYLGNAQNDLSNLGIEEVKPEEYLEEITGDPEQVKLVGDASDLAKEILTFDTPEISTLDKDSVEGTHAAAGLGDKEVLLESLEPDPTREGVWKFVTEPIELITTTGEEITNEIVLTVKTEDGREIEARVEINFSLEDEDADDDGDFD